tara:strand:+ start:15233 stop:16441 length:1209 start_codon:yes stop_codon:yes gene_type:complete
MTTSYIDSELFSLADETIAALASPKRGLIGQPSIFRAPRSNARKAANTVYKNMRQATRFVLEDELTEYVARLSAQISAERVYQMLTEVARLPTDLIWVEWNEKVRVKEINAAVDNFLEDTEMEHISDRVGYLCENTGDDRAMFTMAFRDNNFDNKVTIANQPFLIGAEKVYMSPVGFELNFSGAYSEEESRRRVADFLYDGDEKSIEGFINTGMSGYNSFESFQSANREASRQLLSRWWTANMAGEKMLELIDSIVACQTHAVHWWCHTDNGKFDSEMLARASSMALTSAEGDARFMICLLGVLNFDWFINEPTRKFAHTRVRYGKVRKGNEYRVITLKLPKKTGQVVNIDQHEEATTTKRLHEVRGHWCVRRKSGKRYWRKAHKRGDKSIGTITKDYKLDH